MDKVRETTRNMINAQAFAAIIFMAIGVPLLVWAMWPMITAVIHG